MLSDDGIENQFKYLEGLISTCRVRGYDIGESVSLADESLRTLRKWIASGELMVVKTCKFVTNKINKFLFRQKRNKWIT